MSSSVCPLCESLAEFYWHQKIHKRDFYHCSHCQLIFVSRDQLLSFSEEKSHYDHHNNSVLTEGYEKFLCRLVDPIKKLKSFNDKGLDFGSGPYPMLKMVLKNAGFSNITIFDPNYANVELDGRFDFITLCEVIEHLNTPNFEVKKLVQLMSEKALLIISTGLVQKSTIFENWSYPLDITHINFFSPETFEYIADKYNLDLKFPEKDLIILQKR